MSMILSILKVDTQINPHNQLTMKARFLRWIPGLLPAEASSHPEEVLIQNIETQQKQEHLASETLGVT